MNDRNVPTHGNMGLCLAKLARKAAALKELDRAIEMDSGYEPAKDNRLVVEQMEEGLPLEAAKFRRVEFSLERVIRENKGRSWRSRFAALFGNDMIGKIET